MRKTKTKVCFRHHLLRHLSHTHKPALQPGMPPINPPTNPPINPPINPPSTVGLAGATGQLGLHLATALASAGFRVVALVRPASLSSPAARRLTTLPHTTVVALADFTDVEAVATVLARERVAALVSAVAGRRNASAPAASLRTAEVDTPLALHEACVRAGCVSRYVIAACPPLSAFEKAGVKTFKSPYLSAKAHMVTALRAAEAAAPTPAVTIVQVAAWCRDVEPLVAALKSSRIAPLVFGGASRLQPIADADLAARIVRGLTLFTDAGATLCIGGPQILTFRELWVCAGGAAGVAPRFVPLPRLALTGLLLPTLHLLGLHKAHFMLALAADVCGADLVGEEAVGATTVEAWLRERAGVRSRL